VNPTERALRDQEIRDLRTRRLEFRLTLIAERVHWKLWMERQLGIEGGQSNGPKQCGVTGERGADTNEPANLRKELTQ